MKRYAASCACLMRSLSLLARLASSTSLRSATEAPPGCCASHSQWRGSSVTSRATTPSLGRPGPRAREIRQSHQNFVHRAAQIEVDRTAVVVENEDRGIFVPIERLFDRSRHGAQIPRGDTAVAFEGDVGNAGS